jgi:5-hydroxyisourate hydrolase
LSPVTTHVLDTARGIPASGVAVTLEQGPDWTEVGSGRTGDDGRIAEFGSPEVAGPYRLRFDTAAYFESAGTPAFFPEVTVQFTVERPEEHHHVPLLLSPFGYSTYRGT